MFPPCLSKRIVAITLVALSATCYARVPVTQVTTTLRNSGAVESALSKNAGKAAIVSTISKETIKVAPPAKTFSSVKVLSPQEIEKHIEFTLKNTPKEVSIWDQFSTDISEIEAQPMAPKGNMHANTLRDAREGFLLHKYMMQGFSKEEALRKVTEGLGPRPSKAWPVTTQGTLKVNSLQGLTLDGVRGDLPKLPIPSNNIYLYRGMGLDESALRNILQKGLNIEDVQSSASAIDIQSRLLSVGTMPVSEEILAPFAIKQIYLAPQANYALHFAYTNSFENGKIPVMVVVKSKWRNGNRNHVITENIPATDFVEVAALVNGPSHTPIWCKVSLAQDGESFIFAPYINVQ